MAVTSCKEDAENGNPSELKAMLSFKNYMTEKGVSASVSLKNTEPAVLIDLTSGETLTKELLSEGDNNGTFLFESRKAATGDDLFFYYPESSSPRTGDGKSVFHIPSVQDGGSVKPVFIGAAKHPGSPDSGTSVNMLPTHTYVLGAVKKGAYSIVSATLRSNSSEGVAGDVSVEGELGTIGSINEAAGKVDDRIVYTVTRSYYDALLEAGVRIYEYTPGFVHSKVFAVDGIYATVGTVNLDFRSLYLHFENGLWLYRTSSVAQVEADFLSTLDQCQEITLESRKHISGLRRLASAVLRVFAPLM